MERAGIPPDAEAPADGTSGRLGAALQGLSRTPSHLKIAQRFSAGLPITSQEPSPFRDDRNALANQLLRKTHPPPHNAATTAGSRSNAMSNVTVIIEKTVL